MFTLITSMIKNQTTRMVLKKRQRKVTKVLKTKEAKCVDNKKENAGEIINRIGQFGFCVLSITGVQPMKFVIAQPCKCGDHAKESGFMYLANDEGAIKFDSKLKLNN